MLAMRKLLLALLLVLVFPAAASACSSMETMRLAGDHVVHQEGLEIEPTNSPTIKALVANSIDGYNDPLVEQIGCQFASDASAMSTAHTEVTSAASAAAAAKTEAESAKASATSAKSEAETAKANAATAKSEVSTQASKVSTLETKVAKLESEVKANNEALVTIKGILKF